MTDIDLDAAEARAVAAMRVLDGDDLDAPIHDVDEMVHDQIALVAEVRRLSSELDHAHDATRRVFDIIRTDPTDDFFEAARAVVRRVEDLEAELAKANYMAVAAYDGNALIQQANAHRDWALDTLREITEAVIDGHDVPRTVRDILNREGLIPKPVTLSPAEEAATMREALGASLAAALDNDYDNHRTVVERMLDTLQDRRDAQPLMRMIPGLFGTRVYGRVLLFHMQALTPLAGDAESVTPRRAQDVCGFSIADLGWPADVLHQDYLDAAAEWDPADRARFDAAVQAWRDAHPEAGAS